MLPLLLATGLGLAFILSSCSSENPSDPETPSNPQTPNTQPTPLEPETPEDPSPESYHVEIFPEDNGLTAIYREMRGQNVPNRWFDRGTLRYFAACQLRQQPMLYGSGDRYISGEEIILALYDLALLHPENQDIARLLQDLRQNRDIQPQVAIALSRGLGNGEILTHRRDEATRLLEDFIANPVPEHEANPNVYLLDLGEIAWVRNDFEAAENYFRQAIQRIPRFSEAYCDLAGLMEALGRHSDALYLSRRAEQVNHPRTR